MDEDYLDLFLDWGYDDGNTNIILRLSLSTINTINHYLTLTQSLQLLLQWCIRLIVLRT